MLTDNKLMALTK